MEKKLDDTEAETRNLHGHLKKIQLDYQSDIEKLKLELSNQCDQNTENVKAKGKYVTSWDIERADLFSMSFVPHNNEWID